MTLPLVSERTPVRQPRPPAANRYTAEDDAKILTMTAAGETYAAIAAAVERTPAAIKAHIYALQKLQHYRPPGVNAARLTAANCPRCKILLDSVRGADGVPLPLVGGVCAWCAAEMARP